jgi:DNA invertase Pin-like site-specific DNA recombinase
VKRKKLTPPPEPKHPKLIGYARVSTREQTLDAQIAELKAAGVEDDYLWVEKVSGVASKRKMRDLALTQAMPGDTFVVWRLDRLTRRIEEAYEIVGALKKRGIRFRSLKENFDLDTASGKFMFGVFALVAEFERNVTIERTHSGLKVARARGAQLGAKKKLFGEREEKAAELLGKGWSPTAVARKFKVSRASIYNRWGAEDIEELRIKHGYHDKDE